MNKLQLNIRTKKQPVEIIELLLSSDFEGVSCRNLGYDNVGCDMVFAQCDTHNDLYMTKIFFDDLLDYSRSEVLIYQFNGSCPASYPNYKSSNMHLKLDTRSTQSRHKKGRKMSTFINKLLFRQD